MWQKEITEEDKIPDLKEEYVNIIKKSKKNTENNIFIHFQFMFTAIILIVSFLLKTGDSAVFEFAKENYNVFFENDTYMESTFSYNTFIEKMQNELRIRFGQLMTVFNNISGKGSADIYPDNVSTKKYNIENKGVAPAKGYISSAYGIRTNPFNSKEKEFHTGLDIAAPKGTFIKAAFDGEVISAGNSQIAGNYIRIQSDNNIITFYAHNQFILVNPGDKILAGQVIATMGDTGYATGPHLHFEFIVNGIRYNPIYAVEI